MYCHRECTVTERDTNKCIHKREKSVSIQNCLVSDTESKLIKTRYHGVGLVTYIRDELFTNTKNINPNHFSSFDFLFLIFRCHQEGLHKFIRVVYDMNLRFNESEVRSNKKLIVYKCLGN